MLIDLKQAGTTTNVTDATQPVILPVPPSGGIPPAAPPSDDHLIIAIRENLLLEKKLDGLRRDVEELKRQQLLKASGSKIPTILKSAICHSDVVVLMLLILMFCMVTTSAQYLPTAEKKVVVCGCCITVSWQDALLNTVFVFMGILANQIIKLHQDKVKLKKVIKEEKEKKGKEDQARETGTGRAIDAGSAPSNAGAGVIPQFAGALLAPIAHPVPSAPPPNTY
ncbi:unnamed protein product [Cylicocyclus nassatus]|uniref:Uncharacterized protein n=1 Tax=Cylicocyclus nassatus TaxID=53992 RepID=A0AA36DKM9_CYLNA|nr:unnamed protein product [Cylicocyclus nassatus]